MSKVTFEDLLTAMPMRHVPGGGKPGTMCFFKDGQIVVLSMKLDFADETARETAETLLNISKRTIE